MSCSFCFLIYIKFTQTSLSLCGKLKPLVASLSGHLLQLPYRELIYQLQNGLNANWVWKTLTDS